MGIHTQAISRIDQLDGVLKGRPASSLNAHVIHPANEAGNGRAQALVRVTVKCYQILAWIRTARTTEPLTEYLFEVDILPVKLLEFVGWEHLPVIPVCNRVTPQDGKPHLANPYPCPAPTFLALLQDFVTDSLESLRIS